MSAMKELLLDIDAAIMTCRGFKVVKSYVMTIDQMIHWIGKHNNALHLGKEFAKLKWDGTKVKSVCDIMGLRPSLENLIWQGYTLPLDKRKA